MFFVFMQVRHDFPQFFDVFACVHCLPHPSGLPGRLLKLERYETNLPRLPTQDDHRSWRTAHNDDEGNINEGCLTIKSTSGVGE